MTEFHIRLQQAMDMRKINQTELCEKTGIPKSAMSQYISGAFKPKQKRTYLLAQALDVDEAWLMGYDVPAEKPTSPTPEITDSQLKFALFGDTEIDDDVLDDVKRLAKLHMELRKQEKNEKK